MYTFRATQRSKGRRGLDFSDIDDGSSSLEVSVIPVKYRSFLQKRSLSSFLSLPLSPRSFEVIADSREKPLIKRKKLGKEEGQYLERKARVPFSFPKREFLKNCLQKLAGSDVQEFRGEPN